MANVPQNSPKKRHTFTRHVAPFAPAALGLAMALAPNAKDHQPPPPPPVIEAPFGQSCENPRFPNDTPGPIDGTSCTVVGNGGPESAQNTAKNNFCAAGAQGSPNTPLPTTLAEMQALQTQAQNQGIGFGKGNDHPLSKTPGPVKDRTELVKLGEGQLVQLIGFVKKARQEGAESVNCKGHPDVPNSDAFHDIHISIVLNPADPECAGIVVEMTPHHRPPEWTADLVNQVGTDKLLVRITGQRMFDSSHTPCVNGSPNDSDPARISLWEIHPIYKFEVCPDANSNCANGGWVALEAWKKS